MILQGKTCQRILDTYDRLQGLVIYSIKRYYNNRHEYEDLIQEGNMVILESIKNFDDSRGVHFLGYVRTVLKYTYLNKHKRKLDLSLNMPISEDKELMDLLESDDDGPLDIILRQEGLLKLRQALSELTDRQREVVIAFYFEGISMNAIAEKLDISYRTVVNTKVRALEKMKASLKVN